MTRLILWAYSLLAWVFWLGTDSIDMVSQNTPIAPMRSASKSLTAIRRHVVCSPAWRLRRTKKLIQRLVILNPQFDLSCMTCVGFDSPRVFCSTAAGSKFALSDRGTTLVSTKPLLGSAPDRLE